jgi:hypothetical protein
VNIKRNFEEDKKGIEYLLDVESCTDSCNKKTTKAGTPIQKMESDYIKVKNTVSVIYISENTIKRMDENDNTLLKKI